MHKSGKIKKKKSIPENKSNGSLIVGKKKKKAVTSMGHIAVYSM